MNSLFGFRNGLHPWRCSSRLDAGHPWMQITVRCGLEESFKGAKESSARSVNVVKGTGWGRVLDLVDEIVTSLEALSANEVGGMGKVEDRHWAVLPKRVLLVTGT